MFGLVWLSKEDKRLLKYGKQLDAAPESKFRYVGESGENTLLAFISNKIDNYCIVTTLSDDELLKTANEIMSYLDKKGVKDVFN